MVAMLVVRVRTLVLVNRVVMLLLVGAVMRCVGVGCCVYAGVGRVVDVIGVGIVVVGDAAIRGDCGVDCSSSVGGYVVVYADYV